MPTDDGSDGPLLGNFTADHNLINHHFTRHFYFCTFYFKDECSVCGKVGGTGNGVLCDVEHILYQGILCFQNFIWFFKFM